MGATKAGFYSISIISIVYLFFFTSYRKNVGWASTCNSMGLTAGYFLGYVMFLALESPQFCNNYVRSIPQEYGIITFSG